MSGTADPEITPAGQPPSAGGRAIRLITRIEELSTDFVLYEGDRIDDKAAEFCRTHGMDQAVVPHLVAHVQEQLAKADTEGVSASADAAATPGGEEVEGPPAAPETPPAAPNGEPAAPETGGHESTASALEEIARTAMPDEDNMWTPRKQPPEAAAPAPAEQPAAKPAAGPVRQGYSNPPARAPPSGPPPRPRPQSAAPAPKAKSPPAAARAKQASPPKPKARRARPASAAAGGKIHERLYAQAEAMRAKHQERVRKQEEALEESQARGGGRGREPAGSGDAAGQQDRLYLQAMDQMIARRKANEARTAERADQALAQCTFRPVVNAKSKPLALPGTAFERLWDNAQQQRAKREQLEKRRREEEEQAVSSDCTFRPNIDAKSKAMSNARVAALRTNKITVFDQLAQDADRRRMRQEEFSLYMPPEATFAPEINDRSKVMASVVMQAVKEGASPTASKSEGASEGGSPQKGPLGKSQVSRMARVKEEMEALQKIDAKTGKPLFKPETGRANVGRELEKGGLPIGDYLYQKELERRQKMEVLAKDTEARRQAVASRRPNASSQRYLEALRGRRFKQVFFYLLQNLGPASGAKGAPAIDMDPLLVPGNPVMESMDGEVRADVEAAAQLLLAKGRSPVKGRSPKKAPRPLATEEVFTALMQEVIATSTIKSRTYLLPVSRQRATDENLTFRPRINPRSKEMAEARRPVGARLEDLLTDEQKLRNARAKAREEEIQQSRMKDCTFAPKLNENRSKEGRAFKEAAARARRTGGPSDAVPMDGDGSGAYGDIEAEVLEALDRAKLGGGPNAPGKVISLRGFPVDDIVGTLEGVDAAVADVAATAGPAGGAAAQGKGASGLLESLQQQLDAIQGQAGGTSEKLKMAWDSDDDA